MKATLLLASLAVLASACGGGAVRTKDAYRDDTQKLLDTASEGIHGCYNAVLKEKPDAAGSVTVDFVVMHETGILRKIKVDSARSTAPEEVQKCVAKYIEDLKLTPPDAQLGEATFTWEFSATEAKPVEPAAPAEGEGEKPAS